MINKLIGEAKKAIKNSYNPYSNFPVGAALLTKEGEIFSACNVENISLSLTICAERNAIFSMVAAGFNYPEILVVYTKTEEPVTPCGACRQVISEFNPHTRIICVCDGKSTLDLTLDKLFAHPFDFHNGNKSPK